ncbi:MAG TPA: glycosyltransferase family 87 protein [Patescibacteria group bacterium]|nr:glycosyltransferase family 87 protein [Patescibacteria group bacterium]
MWQKLLTGFLYLFYAIVFLSFGYSLYKITTTYAPDFSVYYQAGWNIVHAKSLYIGFHAFTAYNYPPITSLIFIPFSFLPYTLAQGIFVLISAISLVLSVLLCLKILKQNISFFSLLLIVSLSFLSFPTKFTLGMGQSNLLAYFFLLFSLLFYTKKKMLLVSVFFAIACFLKPILILFVFFFLLEKQWKILFSVFLIFLFCLLLQIAFFPKSFSDSVYYVTTVLPKLMDWHGRGVYYNQGIVGFVFRTFGENQLNLFLSDIMSVAILLISLIKAATKHVLGRAALLLATIPLIDSLSWQHHFVFLLFPFCYSFFTVYQFRNWKVLALLILSYLLVSINIKNPGALQIFPINFLLSHTFYGAFLLWIVLQYNVYEIPNKVELQTKR